MDFAPFDKVCAELSNQAFIHLLIDEHPIIPTGEYIFVELFCTDRRCDCRKVIVHVRDANSNHLQTILHYGWESRAYYKKWFGGEDSSLDWICGAHLEPRYTDLMSQAFLNLFRDRLQQHADYNHKIKEHYAQFKKQIGNAFTPYQDNVLIEKIGRNDLCPCNSGKKYKKCCLH